MLSSAPPSSSVLRTMTMKHEMSYSGFQPERVRSLMQIEPPRVMWPGRREFEFEFEFEFEWHQPGRIASRTCPLVESRIYHSKEWGTGWKVLGELNLEHHMVASAQGLDDELGFSRVLQRYRQCSIRPSTQFVAWLVGWLVG